MTADCVFLFDVDNTLLDNDRIQADLSDHMAESYGDAARDRYWAIFEALRTELGYADYLGALERYRLEDMHEPRVLQMAPWLVDYPFADRLYPGALDAVKHVERWGLPVILSDGDAVFQPVKVARSGLTRAFSDRVLIYVHKELELDQVERLRPARRYVMVDDKLRILTAMKKSLGAAPDHGVRPPGALCARQGGGRQISRRRSRNRRHRRSRQARFLGVRRDHA